MPSHALLLTTFASFGDLIYQTPLIRLLSSLHDTLDVWCRNHEPFLNNPNVREVYRMASFRVPEPRDFYFDAVYRATTEPDGLISRLPQSNIHTVDYFTVGTCNLVLRDKEKDLELFWTKADEDSMRAILQEHNIDPDGNNFTVICPAITWPSRTLPLPFYQELITRIYEETGDKVIIVGKDLSYTTYDPDREKNDPAYAQYAIKEAPKQLYSVSEFNQKAIVDLTNKLTLHQLAALYSLTKIAVNTENGNMVMSCTNKKCWNLYIPTLTAPEYRTPHRYGSMTYKTTVVGNEEDYYPASSYDPRKDPEQRTSLINRKIKLPTVDAVINAYHKASEAIKNGNTRAT